MWVKMELSRFDDDTDDDIIPESESTPLRKKGRASGTG
mgnify:CR=1 FL=1